MVEKEKYITFCSERKTVALDVASILYAMAEDDKTKIHTVRGEVYETHLALYELAEALGDGFLRVRRNTLVAASAIESVSDCVNLKNGETLRYPARQKRRIVEELLRQGAQEVKARLDAFA